MGVIITRTTESHLDYFTRNLTVGKDSLVATAHGYVSAARLADATHEPLDHRRGEERICGSSRASTIRTAKSKSGSKARGRSSRRTPAWR